MDSDHLKKEIANTLNALVDQTQNILSHENKIPQIEIDIAMGNIRKLYEDFSLLDQENRQKKAVNLNRVFSSKMTEVNPQKEEKSQPVKESKSEIPKEETFNLPREEAMPKPEPPKISSTSKAEDVPKPKPPETPSEKSPEIRKPIAEEKKEEKKESKPKAQEEKPKEKVRTADLFTDNGSTLADKFMSEMDSSLGARMQKNKIKDLKDAIGINEKFLFINDLFDGNMHDYNNAVENINSMGTLQQAKSLINNLKDRYKWDVKPDAVNHFMSYVERRFGNE